MNDKKLNNRTVPGIAIMLFAAWIIILVGAILSDRTDPSSHHYAHGTLFAGDLLIFLLLAIRRKDIAMLLRVSVGVVRHPFASTIESYDDFFFVASAAGAIITILFYVDMKGADVLAVRGGIVILLISLKLAFDRWRAGKRKGRQ